MIHRFSDKASNERTYLAWTRTILSVVGFAILIEKLGPTGTTRPWFAPVLVGLAAGMLVLATIRHEITRRMITDDNDDDPRYVWSERMMIGMIALLLVGALVFVTALV